MNDLIASEDLQTRNYGDIISSRRRTKKKQKQIKPGTIGHYFHIHYGQKELHSKENLLPGDGLVISSSGTDNGFYGFFDFSNLISPPFATVPSTGSIGEAHVQNFACGVTDDCLLLLPKDGTPYELLYVAVAAVRRERWRFDYGRKITPERIQDIPIVNDEELNAWISNEIDKIDKIKTTIRTELVTPRDWSSETAEE